MLRKLGIGFIALAAMTPGLAAALGVGEYQLDSYLNQPLDMNVELNDVGDLSSDEIIVNLASQGDFETAGVERGYFLSDLRFDVQVDHNGGATLHIRSRQPVREPYLNFLVEFRWPTGRLMREYTVLLDPPSYDDDGERVAPAKVEPSPRPRTQSQPAKPDPAPPAPRKERPSAAADVRPDAEKATDTATDRADTDRTYQVRASDTMWRIASQHRPSEEVSVQQTMMAIQEMNPDAFIDENVNLIREGAVLRLPSSDQVRYVPARQALSELASQNRQWRQAAEQRAEARDPKRTPLDASGRQEQASQPDSGDGEGRVTLVAAAATEDVADGDGTGTEGSGDANTAALQNELAIRDENLDRLNRDNDELRSRLGDIQEQMATSQRLMELRNEQIVALQQELRRLKDEQGVDVDPALLDAPEQAPANQPDAASADDRQDAARDEAADGTETGAANDAAAPAPQANTANDDTTPARPATGAGIVDLIMQNLLYVAALVVILLLLLLLLLRRRNKGYDGGDDDFPDDHDDFGGDGLSGGGGGDFGEPPPEDLDDDRMDPMERADVYVAYGQYPQAVDYLRNEINQQPERGDLKIRLLELLRETDDEPGFHQQAAMFAGTSVAVDAAIKRLGGDPGERLEAGDEELSLDDLELDLASDLSDAPVYQAEPADSAAPAGGQEQEEALEFSDFDFTLDEEEPAPVALNDEAPLQLDDLVLGGDDDQDLDDPLELDGLDDGADQPGDGDHQNPFADLDLEELDVALNDVAEPDTPASRFEGENDESALEASLTEDDLDFSLDDLELDPPPTAPVEPSASEPSADLEDLDFYSSEPATEEESPTHDEPLEPSWDAPESAGDGDEEDESFASDEDFDFLGETNENATKLDLARAYIDMGDAEGARDILNEVLSEGSEEQQGEAKELLARLD